MKGLPAFPEDSSAYKTSPNESINYIYEKNLTAEFLPATNSRPFSKLLNVARWGLICAGVAYLGVGQYYPTPDAVPTVDTTATPDLCLEPECIHAASEILYNLDPHYQDIDPCVNFDQYVCGGWIDRHDMRPDQGSIFAGTLMAENAQMRLRHILEAPEAPGEQTLSSADKDNFKKLKAAYDACIDVDALKERGSQPLEDILSNIDAVYSSQGKDSETNITDTLLYLMQIDVSALTDFSISPDDRDPDNVVIFVTPPRRIGLPSREYYNDSKVVRDYYNLAAELFGNFIPLDHVLSDRLAKDVVQFEKKLADATPDTQAQEDVTQYYNPKTLEEAGSLIPQISFGHIVAGLAPDDFKTDRLIIGSPSYLKELSAIIQDTPRDVVQAFFKFKAIQRYYDDIEDPKVAPLREFNNRLAGKDPQATQDRWRKCINNLDSGIGWILSRFYVIDSFPEESKQLGDQIISDIKEQFVYVLDGTKWMSAEVRQLGKQKVANIIQKIGYPTRSPDLTNGEDVKNYYSRLHISSGKFFENSVAMSRFEFERTWSQLGKPTNRDEWGMTAPTVNAYYNPPGNEIVFPAGIMQPPTFYGPRAPLYLAYGAFGAVSGHELSHAFDSTGRHYDQIGNYTNWWDDKTIEAFEERAQCFIDQYSNFTVPGPDPDSKPLHVNGRLTLGENIADAGGLSASFHAWKKRDSAHADKALPGLENFTKEQLFFISYSNWWCSKTTREAAVQAIYTDPHAPKPARILGTMANTREFQEAFECPRKEPVCKLW
ncbi:endothelin-converting enzyme [Talaromyces stipitatus ATCC 10500]|uniref:Endothelin-converting enzyme n=1 Tax=Talaromyces stipitatus (strain ATCC 10500 / CBS 375.48 / QM 6759 / NRRL 1006) TaxID=441959 RepID=B8M651_TALSN|nr:endothelin-converting enzyme [Talaromyces stipitatus ATCC 10500]EED19051.1 endothelin-converting enzyme [Talaromyces stipitatus ATCC 10500]